MIAAVGPNAPMLQTMLLAVSNGDSIEPAVVGALAHQLAPAYALILPLVLVGQAIILCGIYRSVLHPENRVYIKLGRDEARMVVLSLATAALGAAVLFLLLLADGFATFLLRGVFGSMIGGVLAVLTASASLCAFVWIGVRLSLAPPMTFVTGELRILESWALTRGKAFSLIGAYGLALILGFITLILAEVIFSTLASAMTLMAGGSMADFSRAFSPNVSSIKAYLTPIMIVSQLFGAGLTAIFNIIVLSPPVVAYNALKRA